MNQADNNIISKVKNSLREIDDNAGIILFGSRATGNPHEESDWDFLFLTSSSITIALRKIIAEKMLSIELSHNILIQVIPKNKTEWEKKYVVTPLYKNIKREGIII